MTSQASDAGPRLPRTLSALVLIAAAVVVLFGIKALGGYVAPLLLALNLYIVAHPVQRWAIRHGAHPVAGVLMATLVVLLILAVFLASLIWSLAAFIEELPGYQSRFTSLYQDLIAQLGKYGIVEHTVTDALQKQVSPEHVTQAATTALSSIQAMLTPLTITLTILCVVLIDSASYPARIASLRTQRPELANALVHFARGVRRYWVVSSIFGLIVACVDVAALIWLGVPLAVVWGVLSFLTNYIPNIGFVLGLVPPMLMALLAKDLTTAIWVAVIYSVANFVIQSIIQPKFSGDAVGVTATVSLLSLFVWAWALGALGALLALPATQLMKAVFVDADPRMKWLDSLIASSAADTQGRETDNDRDKNKDKDKDKDERAGDAHG